MPQLLNEAGPLGLPILLVGAFAIVFAVRFALRPSSRVLAQCLGATLLTNLVALLSSILGYQRSVSALPRAEVGDRWVFLLGLSEALNAMVVSLAISVVVVAVVTTGAMRQAGPSVATGSARTI